MFIPSQMQEKFLPLQKFGKLQIMPPSALYYNGVGDRDHGNLVLNSLRHSLRVLTFTCFLTAHCDIT